MRSASISLPLNFFVFPMGYLYLKDSKRFVLGTLYIFFQPVFVSLIIWLNPKFFPAWVNAPLVFALGILVLLFILIDTYRLTRRGGGSSTWLVFAKPHAFWFVPVFLIVLGILSVLLEPWEKPFARTHNIPSASMEPNVQLGDFIFADYMINHDTLKRGDIVLYRGTGAAAGKTLLQRIVGMPGDRLRFYSEQVFGAKNQRYTVKRIKINDTPLPIAAISAGRHQLMPADQEAGLFREGFPEAQYDILDGGPQSSLPEKFPLEVVLGSDDFFLMGDNRDHSYDSRFSGTVSRERIIGKYLHTYFSFFIPNPECEVHPPLLFSFRVLTESKSQPCGSVSIRWEKAGYVAR
jgi:signal peptidase I